MENQQKSNEYYREMAGKERDVTVAVGRSKKDSKKEKRIFSDIIKKLNIKKGERILDIGCGCGTIAKLWENKVKGTESKITLMDIPEVIKRIRRDNPKIDKRKNIELLSGMFPGTLEERYKRSNGRDKYDKIILYSVIQCTNNPIEIIKEAIKYLEKGGTIMIGDIPNISKKGRFLCTTFGRAFDAKYKGKAIEECNEYENHKQFEEGEKASNKALIDDKTIIEIIKISRDKGLNAYIVPQAKELPFSYTREDILIVDPEVVVKK